jgi:LPXTG-motif cell wall-anchored protein
MRTSFFKLTGVIAVTSVTVVLMAAGIASAHIDPDPIAMQAGTSGTVAFHVEHGCDGSPTTSMKFEIPDGVSGVTPVDKAGWTATLTGKVLEFKGGPLAADQEDHFDITITAPVQPGDIHFKVIQTCEQGELAWIEEAAEGAPEPEHPAPTIKITQGPPTSAELTPVPDATDVATDGTVVATATDVISPAVTTASADDSSNTGAIVGVIIGAVIVLGGGGIMLARRRKTPPPV